MIERRGTGELQIEHGEAPSGNGAGMRRRGGFGRNIAANLANACLNILVGAWFTPYLIQNLGVAAYGLVPLTMAVASYLGLLTLSLNSTVGRYLTISLEQGDSSRAVKIFNTSLFGSAAIVLLMAGPGVWLAWHADLFFRVPNGAEAQIRILLLCGVGAFMIATIGGAFEVASFCRNRFDLRNVVTVAGTFVRVGLVVLLFSLLSPSLWYVGVAILAASLVSFIGVVLVKKMLIPELVVRAREFDFGVMRELMSTGGWIVINQIGTLLFLSIDLIVVNRLLGAKAGGEYAAVLQWSVLLRGIAGTVAVVFAPTLLYYYAQKDISGLTLYSRRAVKFLGLVIALPIGLICGLSEPLLHVWLGKGFVHLAPLMSLMTLHLCINLGVLPLFNIQLATNDVRWPGIVTCAMGLANLGLALILAGPVGWGMYGVAAAGAITLTAKNAIFVPLYGAHIIGRRRSTFYREMFPIILFTIAVAAACVYGSRLIGLASWPRILLFGSSVSLVYAAAVYRFALTNEERAAAKGLSLGSRATVAETCDAGAVETISGAGGR